MPHHEEGKQQQGRDEATHGLTAALREFSNRVGQPLEVIAQSLGGASAESLGDKSKGPIAASRYARTSKREEVVLCYTVGDLHFVPFKTEDGRTERYGILDMKLYDVRSGLDRPNGRYRVIWKPLTEDPEELFRRPSEYKGPWGVAHPIEPHMRMRADTYAEYTFDDINSTIHASGPTYLLVIPLSDGSAMFHVTGAVFVTGGTGRYEGCSGVGSALGSSFVPKGNDIFRINYDRIIPAVTVSTFRVVLKKNIGEPPARREQSNERGKEGTDYIAD